MISKTSIFFMCITLVISLILPIVVLIIYAVANKGKKVVSAWFLGAAGFFVMQVILRLPILSVVSLLPGYADFVGNHYVLYSLILGFTAGLFEVVGRLVVAKLMSKELTFERSVAAGLGHGGIEAMILIGITYINNLAYTFMINSGSYDLIVEQTAAMGVDVSSLYAVKESLINTPAYLFGLAGFERILAMIGHVAMTMLVCYFVSRKQTLKGVLIALGLHTLLDSVSAILSGMSTAYMGNMISQNTGYVLIYSFLVIMSIVFAAIIISIKKRFAKE